jgi:peptidyl-prolyl cis-trans isomerase SurA
MRRPTAVLVLGLIAGVALTGCRTSPNVAAYVGDETITVDELDAAVTAHRDDPEVTAGEDPDYSRAILSELVRSEVFSSAAEHFGVASDPGGLDELLDQLLQGQDREAYFTQAGAQGYSRADALERVRQVALLQAIAVAEGAAEEPTEAGLREDYAAGLAAQPAQVDLGYVNVPDQAAADAAVAALQADPGSYAAVAGQYPGQATLPAPQTVAVDDLATQLPADLAAQVTASPSGSVFATPVEGVPGLLVVVVGEAVVPAFEEVRPQLEAAAANDATNAGAELLAEYEDGLDIDVNPRYGSLTDGSVVEPEGGVVEFLGTDEG